jgi:SYP6 family syntaxin
MEDPLLLQQKKMGDPLLHPLDEENELGPFAPPPIGLETDPFYAFRDELAHSTRKTLGRVERLKLLTTSEEILSEIASVNKALYNLKEGASDLERVVSHVERRRSDFTSLSEEDIQSRRSFLRIVQSRIKMMEGSLINAHQLADELVEQERRQKKSALEAKQAAVARVSKKVEANDDDESDMSLLRYRQEQMLKDQDESLDEISLSLGRLHAVGGEMYQEIESQNHLLDDINQNADTVSGKMEGALSRLDKFLHTSSRGQTLSITFLIVVLLIEIILVSVI